MNAQVLYDWERNYVEPKAQAYLSREGCLDLVREASAMSGMRPPEVRFAKAASMHCRAVPSKWQIVIADWGRNPVTVLHEVAHLATLDAVARGEDPHGSSFLGQAMAYYSRFLGLDEFWLRQTAAAVGLASPSPPERKAAGGFSEVEF